jgi:phospholipid transport system substrate-binding protein
VRLITTAFATLLTLFAPQLLAAPQGTASDLIESTSDRILSEIKVRRDEFKADDTELQRFVRTEMNKVLDQGYTARLVLGLHSRTASAEQIDAFGKALSDNLNRRYAKALLEIDGNTKVKVLGETALRGGKIIRAKTSVIRSSGAPVAVDYLFRDVNNEWRAFDLIVEGISYVQTFRSQFDPLIREKGLDQVTEDLREGRIEVDTETKTQ